ncbi:MAG: TrkH family potassium uptake protein [Clostridia bacterium]|nr:TrkH family potassium uptake protein [Clostridia bacterium]
MNFAIIKRTLGWILIFEALFFVLPIITGLIYQETQTWAFVWTVLICLGVGSLLVIGKVKNPALYAKEGFVIVAGSWILMSLFGALPFVFSGEIPSYVDALFETVSGFTTTGSSILSGEQIENMSKCLLMWRSFTHWIGGMGVLVFILAFLPLCGGGNNINLLRAESPGPSVSKLLPKMRSTAGVLYIIYAMLTVIQVIFLVFDMPLFDAITTSFATAGTGGFGIRADSCASYSVYSQIVVTVFMVLFSINFTSFFLVIRGRFKEAWTAEVRAFLTIVIVAITLISINLCLTPIMNYGVGTAIKDSAFSVASIISTTGFAVTDFNTWPAFSKTILVLLMFVGACAGSTGGGLKVSRWIIFCKGANAEMRHVLHPKQVKKITMDNRVVEHEVVRGVNGYLSAYILIFLASLLLISIEGHDLITNFTALAATINNVGPGLNLVGPSGNFSFFGDFSKIVFVFDMLVGRLEIFPMLVLFSPSTWKK